MLGGTGLRCPPKVVDKIIALLPRSMILSKKNVSEPAFGGERYGSEGDGNHKT
jgi:hypothetical protein